MQMKTFRADFTTHITNVPESLQWYIMMFKCSCCQKRKKEGNSHRELRDNIITGANAKLNHTAASYYSKKHMGSIHCSVRRTLRCIILQFKNNPEGELKAAELDSGIRQSVTYLKCQFQMGLTIQIRPRAQNRAGKDTPMFLTGQLWKGGDKFGLLNGLMHCTALYSC